MLTEFNRRKPNVIIKLRGLTQDQNFDLCIKWFSRQAYGIQNLRND